MYFKYQNQDEADGWGGYNKPDRLWHLWGGVQRRSVDALLMAAAILGSAWQDVLLSTMIQLPLYDISINLLALGKPALYPGSSTEYDKRLGMLKWPMYLVFIAGAVAVKVFY